MSQVVMRFGIRRGDVDRFAQQVGGAVMISLSRSDDAQQVQGIEMTRHRLEDRAKVLRRLGQLSGTVERYRLSKGLVAENAGWLSWRGSVSVSVLQGHGNQRAYCGSTVKGRGGSPRCQ